ncbi:MAG TPA: UDP-N-acetylmuramoyl-tripeptide--D-alanyl-D-alanine ligase [Bryobacteraceae bacterium]|jgi:UDP-N-acetylmuramoyl-tripeptide--D-alanyl-D-alanine ligase|nr:UDP-N-acetylmuramoyl-tripeptide--D-alanyl-D-alanine ligase [Bryobacteraceae bacterium]
MELTVAQIIDVTGAEFSGDPALLPQPVRGWSIDSRSIGSNDLFFAIRGEIHDGHAYVSDVLAHGAIAAVVSEPVEAVPVLRVANTVRALQQLAHFVRKSWGGRVVGVTGSAGKTSTKEVIAACLAGHLTTGKTFGNFNNHLGLPLSILRLPVNAEVAVLEMGMNHAGEIRELARIAEPDVGVVTNVGFAHVEMFDGIEGIAAAKRELIEELPAGGVAVLNADDERVRTFSGWHRGRSVTYGFSNDADVQATGLTSNGEVSRFCIRGVPFETHLPGRHSISNVLAGVAVAGLFEISPAELTETVAALRPTGMRGERFAIGSTIVLNDSYNSNPEAARSMVDVLGGEPAKRRIAVLGEMRELGPLSERLHRELGEYVAGAPVDVLVGIAGASDFMVKRAIECGLDPRNAFYFPDAEKAGCFLREFVQPGDAILFKGSRGTHVEKALAKIQN